jgi:hypothetical protein
MDVVTGILIFGVLIGVGLLVNYLRNQATKALNQKVFDRGGHARGKTSTQEIIEFSAPVPAARVISAIRDRLGLRTDQPVAFVAALYLAESRSDVLAFGFGNKVATTFRSIVMSEDTPGGGSHTIYRVTNWVEGDGLVRGVAEMELLANTVRLIAAELGGVLGSAQMPAGPSEPSVPELASVPAVGARAQCALCGSTELGVRFCTECGAAVA